LKPYDAGKARSQLGLALGDPIYEKRSSLFTQKVSDDENKSTKSLFS
jgi:hypothetical protein